MKNPNWRRRGQSESESGPTESPNSQASLENRHSIYKESTGSPHYNNISENSGIWDFAGLPPSGTICGDENTPKPKATQPACQDPDSQGASGGLQSPVCCQILTRRDLPDVLPLSIFEVRPVDNARDRGYYPAIDVVEFRRIAAKSSGQREPMLYEGKDEQSEQFAAALEAVDKTPQKVRLPVEHAVRPPNMASIPHTALAASTNKDSCSQTSSVIYNYHPYNDVDNGKALRNDCNVSHGEMEDRQSRNQGGDSAAFQRMLEKLRKRSQRFIGGSGSVQGHAQGPGNKTDQSRVGAVQGYVAASGHSVSTRRDPNHTQSSDSGYGSLPSNCNTESTESGSKSYNGIFNPRAREFLSFVGKGQQTGGKDDYQKFRRVPVEELFAKSGASTRLNSPGADPVPPYKPAPVTDNYAPFVQTHQGVGHCNVASPPLGVNSFPGNFAHPAATWSPGQFPNFALPTAMPVPPSLANGDTWASGFPNSLLGTGFIPLPGAGLIPPPDFIAKARISPPPAAPVGGPDHSARPGPVPKPRKPDPRDQQAYEAWIEWRKANEPGYAMECKLRQQRRSQRNTATKPKSESVSKSEVEAAA